jgi:hypothetical protein
MTKNDSVLPVGFHWEGRDLCRGHECVGFVSRDEDRTWSAWHRPRGGHPYDYGGRRSYEVILDGVTVSEAREALIKEEQRDYARFARSVASAGSVSEKHREAARAFGNDDWVP